MKRKFILTLVLFFTFFLAFMINAKAYDCIYYQYTDSKDNPDNTQKLEVRDYGNKNGGYLVLNGQNLLTGPYGVITLKYISFIGEKMEAGTCPPYVKITVNGGMKNIHLGPKYLSVYYNTIASTLPKAFETADGEELENFGTFVASEEETTAPIAGEAGGGISIGGEDVENTCEGILGQDFIDFLNDYIFTPLKIVAPILLLIFTTLDFSKAVFAEDKDSLKKAQSKFIKRTAAVIILFLLSYILDLIFTVIANGMIDVCV